MSDLIDKINNFKNVKIVNIPRFVRYYINEGMINSEFLSVYNFNGSTIEYIRSNEYKSIFYIYQIEENNARWIELDTEIELRRKLRRKLRKEKLKKLEKI